MEKKGLPEHLQQLDNLEAAVTLSPILTDMQDVGEAATLQMKCFLTFSNTCFPT